jgi:hypothetical protein
VATATFTFGPSQLLSGFNWPVSDQIFYAWFAQLTAGFLFGLLFYPEDGGYIFLRNTRLSPKHTALILFIVTAVRTSNLIYEFYSNTMSHSFLPFF